MKSLKKISLPKLSVGKLGKPLKISLFIVLIILSLFVFYNFVFLDRIYPNVYVSGINVGGLTTEEAEDIVEKQVFPYKIVLTKEGKEHVIHVDTFKLKYDIPLSVKSAIDHYDPFNTPDNLYHSLSSPFVQVNIPLIYTIDEESLLKEIDSISQQTSFREPVYPGVSLIDDSVVVEMGSPGEGVDKEKLIKDIKVHLSFPSTKTIPIALITNDPTITQDQALLLTERANILLDKSLIFTFENSSFVLKKNDILELLSADGGYKEEKIKSTAEHISTNIERQPQNPIFVFAEGKVTEFNPAKDGITLDTQEYYVLLEDALVELENTEVDTVTNKVPTLNTPPDYTTSDVNDLGINELIGRGTSTYIGSIPSRIHNLALASKNFNGVLLKPGETFSFNETLGEVSNATGYQQAYIIKDGRTELGDGGGVCQVSTTLFRAILDAGLPVTERRAHSYRVTYYEQGSPPGLDATVYEPSPDLKFKNDTPGHILIQSVANTKALTLVFEIYGTSDGRVSSISKPIVSSVSPPPEDLYTDDPTLPVGTVKQIDWKAWGAKVVFDYTVVRDGETIIDETYYSNYKPWQAKFLRGTGPAQ
jgi:vancomycin resistance protein YoaR